MFCQRSRTETSIRRSAFYGLSKEKLIAYAVEEAACYSEERNKAKEALVCVIVKEQAHH